MLIYPLGIEIRILTEAAKFLLARYQRDLCPRCGVPNFMAPLSYDIYYYYADGQKKRMNWPTFISVNDAIKSLSMLQSLPDEVLKATVEDTAGQWYAERTKKVKTDCRTWVDNYE
jgi:hypothetical protein